MEFIGSEKDKLVTTGQELSMTSDSIRAQDIIEKGRTVHNAWSDLQELITKRFVWNQPNLKLCDNFKSRAINSCYTYIYVYIHV
jgi:hypothetical protein